MENKKTRNNNPESIHYLIISVLTSFSPKRLKQQISDQTTLKIFYLFFKALQLNKTTVLPKKKGYSAAKKKKKNLHHQVKPR